MTIMYIAKNGYAKKIVLNIDYVMVEEYILILEIGKEFMGC